MDLGSLLLAPIRVPLRVGQALDDLATLAERARRDPDPVEEVRERIDALLAAIATLTATAREIVDGGAELTAEARGLRGVAREIRDGGTELTAVAREIRDGGAELTLEARGLRGVSRELEESVETVADTVEPLQGAAESVGRVTRRFSRSA